MTAYRIEHFRTSSGADPFGAWFDALRDPEDRQRVAARVDRLAVGLFGDAKMLRGGVRELRIDSGPGYRVYYGIVGRTIVLLLCAGTKRTQRGDISRAMQYWRAYQGQP